MQDSPAKPEKIYFKTIPVQIAKLSGFANVCRKSCRPGSAGGGKAGLVPYCNIFVLYSLQVTFSRERKFMENAIALKHITKTFGLTTAVRDFNLVVPPGALYGLIGPNGAGKTTIIRMILAILFPDFGELSVFGQSSIKDVRHRIGYLPEERGVYRKMRVGEFLTFMGRLKGVNDADIRRLIPEWLEKTGLSSVVKKRCEELSKGMQQKIQFITAVMHRPDMLIFDEPFSGLDPVNQRLLRDLVLEERRRGATILFSTHVMAHAEQLCDHIVMIYQGNKVLDGTPSEILRTSDSRRILFEPLEPSADVEKLRETPGVRDVRREGALWEITISENARLAEVIPALAASVVPAHIQIRRPTLEDVFVSIVTGKDGDSAGLRTSLRGESGNQEAE